jgi:hypothetical protein
METKAVLVGRMWATFTMVSDMGVEGLSGTVVIGMKGNTAIISVTALVDSFGRAAQDILENGSTTKGTD